MITRTNKHYRLFHGFILIVLFCASLVSWRIAAASEITLDASKLLPHTSLSFAPLSGTFVEGATFEVPILLSTQKNNVNAIEVHVIFDPNKLSIVQSTGGKSIIGVWVETPTFDNSLGTVKYVGIVPGGITTDSGLIATITFKAKATGRAVVKVRSDSSILLNDGLGSQTQVDFGRADYDIIAKPPEGVKVYSETHPLESHWYNNNNPVISWEKDPDVTGFSFVLDDKPSTIPENALMATDTVKAYQNLGDGLWHFHIKAYKKGVWGTAGHFLLRIDTTPPALFTPQTQYVLAAAALVERTILSFSTTDNLSGINHYEVGTIDKSQPITEAPVFVETESPYQVPVPGEHGLTVIVRAVDNAGNVRDVSLDIKAPILSTTGVIFRYLPEILIAILLIIITTLVTRYFIGHHVLAHFRRALGLIQRDTEPDTARLTPPTRYVIAQEVEGVPVATSVSPPAPVSMSSPAPNVSLKGDTLKQ